jgi:hypothetical protein
MSQNFANVIIQESDRHLLVAARWTVASQAWAIVIEDASPGKIYNGKRIGELVIGQSTAWGHTRKEAGDLRKRVIRLARTGEIH